MVPIEPVQTRRVETTGVKYFKPSGIFMVKWLCEEYLGGQHEIILEIKFYPPESLINFLSVKYIARQLNYPEETCIQTCLYNSTFKWDNEKFL